MAKEPETNNDNAEQSTEIDDWKKRT
jgi:hypothetical protein